MTVSEEGKRQSRRQSIVHAGIGFGERSAQRRFPVSTPRAGAGDAQSDQHFTRPQNATKQPRQQMQRVIFPQRDGRFLFDAHDNSSPEALALVLGAGSNGAAMSPEEGEMGRAAGESGAVAGVWDVTDFRRLNKGECVSPASSTRTCGRFVSSFSLSGLGELFSTPGSACASVGSVV